MKKLALISILLLVAFAVGCEEGMLYNLDEDQVLELTEITEMDFSGVEPEDPEVPDETPETPEEPIFGIAKFDGPKYTTDGFEAGVMGNIFDSETDEPIAGATIQLVCENVVIAESDTDSEGSFFMTVGDECRPGDKAWIVVEYNDKLYVSKHVKIPGRIVGGGGTGPSFSMGTSSAPKESVPEFSTATMALAVLSVTLGIAFVRKN